MFPDHLGHALGDVEDDPRLATRGRCTDDLRARLRLAALAIQQDCRRQRGLRVLARHCEQRRCEPTTAVMIAEPEQLHDEEHMRRMQRGVPSAFFQTPSTCGSFSMKSHASFACHSSNTNGPFFAFARFRSSRYRFAAKRIHLPNFLPFLSAIASRA